MAENKFNLRKEAFLRTKVRFGITEKPQTKIVFCKNCPEKVVAVTTGDFNYPRLCLDCAVAEAAARNAKLREVQVITEEEESAVWKQASFAVAVIVAMTLLGFAIVFLMNFLGVK